MMLMPRKNDFDIFGGFFDDPFFNESKHKEIMKTDIKEGLWLFKISSSENSFSVFVPSLSSFGGKTS